MWFSKAIEQVPTYKKYGFKSLNFMPKMANRCKRRHNTETQNNAIETQLAGYGTNKEDITNKQTYLTLGKKEEGIRKKIIA